MAGVIDQLFSGKVFADFEKFVQNVMTATDTVSLMTKEVSDLVGRLGSLKSMTDVQQFLGKMQQTESRISAAEAARAEVMKLLNAEQEKLAGTAKELAAANQKIAATERQLAALTEKRATGTRNITAAQLAANAQAKQYTGIAVNEARAAIALEGSYEQLNARLNALRATYKTFNEAGQRSAFGKNMLDDINKLDGRLKKIDGDMGVHTRHVGNYSGAIAGLNMNLTQVVRELPNVSLGLNTFILSMSNNIPMLADSITRLREANKAAAAEGHATVPVWKSIAKGLGSWGTVITIVVTLLVAFSGKISAWVKGLKEGRDAMEAFNEVQKESNENIRKGAQASQDEITKLKVLYTATQDVTKSMQDRNKAADLLRQEYPKYFGNLTNEEILLGKAKTGYDSLIKSVINLAIAKATIDEVVKEEKKLQDLLAKRGEALAEQRNAKRTIDQIKQMDAATANIGRSWKLTRAIMAEEDAWEQVEELNTQIKAVETNTDRLVKSIPVDLFDKLFGDTGKNNSAASIHVSVPTITVDKPDIKFEPETIQEIKDEYKALQQQINATLGIIDRESRQAVVSQNNELAELAKQYEQGYITKAEYEKQKADITEKYIAQSENAVIDSLKRLGEQYKNDERLYPLIAAEIAEEEIKIAQRRSKRLAEIGEKSAEDRERAEDELKQAIEQTWNDISGSVGQIAAGMSERRMQEIEEEAKLAELEAERVQKSIDAEQKRLDNAIMTDEARALQQEIIDAKQAAAEEKKRQKDEQIEQRRRQEEIRAARFQKQWAIMQAVINTALAISKAIPNPVVMAFAAAAGAAQLAAIVAQPLPKYARGGTDIPGGLSIVGDGGRHEVYESPLGRLMVTPKIPTLINAERGANIYPDMNSFIRSQFEGMKRFRESQGPEGLTDRHVDRIIDALKSRSKGDVHVNMTRQGTLDVWLRNQKRLKVLGNELFI